MQSNNESKSIKITSALSNWFDGDVRVPVVPTKHAFISHLQVYALKELRVLSLERPLCVSSSWAIGWNRRWYWLFALGTQSGFKKHENEFMRNVRNLKLYRVYKYICMQKTPTLAPNLVLWPMQVLSSKAHLY